MFEIILLILGTIFTYLLILENRKQLLQLILTSILAACLFGAPLIFNYIPKSSEFILIILFYISLLVNVLLFKVKIHSMNIFSILINIIIFSYWILNFNSPILNIFYSIFFIAGLVILLFIHFFSRKRSIFSSNGGKSFFVIVNMLIMIIIGLIYGNGLFNNLNLYIENIDVSNIQYAYFSFGMWIPYLVQNFFSIGDFFPGRNELIKAKDINWNKYSKMVTINSKDHKIGISLIIAIIGLCAINFNFQFFPTEKIVGIGIFLGVLLDIYMSRENLLSSK